MICKPKRMPWRTFNLLMNRAEQLAQQADPPYSPIILHIGCAKSLVSGY